MNPRERPLVSVAKDGPSPVDRESAENGPERARLGNPECREGASEGGPEREAGGHAGWFGTVGEGSRIQPGSDLRVAGAVLGAVDVVWWLVVRLAWLCGLRADEQDDLPRTDEQDERRHRGALWVGVGWTGGAPEAWIGLVPADELVHDGWPVGWRWERHEYRPPLWNHPQVQCDDRCAQEPGSVAVLVRGNDGRARLAAWATAWGDRWQARGFDRERLIRLLRAEITDAELRAEERDGEDDPDAADDEIGIDGLPELPAGLEWQCQTTGEIELVDGNGDGDQIGEVFPYRGRWSWAWYDDKGPKPAHGTEDVREEAARVLAALAWQQARRAAVAELRTEAAHPDERPPATCPTGQEPAVADLPKLPPGFRWRVAVDDPRGAVVQWTAPGGDELTDATLSRTEKGTAWRWMIFGSSRLGASGAGTYATRSTAAARIAREIHRRVDEATTREGLERQANGGKG